MEALALLPDMQNMDQVGYLIGDAETPNAENMSPYLNMDGYNFANAHTPTELPEETLQRKIKFIEEIQNTHFSFIPAISSCIFSILC
jgi:hypothetical protein